MENVERLGDAAQREFGGAVRSQRLARSLTQDALATRMTELGCPMTQTTVAKIERGDRPTPISEAAVLAYIFDVSVDALLPLDEASAEISRIAELKAESWKLMRQITGEGLLLRNATERFLTAQDRLRGVAAALGVDDARGQAAGSGTTARGIYYALNHNDPVQATERAVKAYHDRLSAEEANERASSGEHSETS